MGDARTMFSVDLAGSAHIVKEFTSVMAEGGAAVLFASMAARLLAGAVDDELEPILTDPLAPDAPERFIRSRAVQDDPAMAYGYAKQGVVRLAARHAATWGQRGARINSVSPGSIDTPMGRQELAGQPAMVALLEQTPIARLGTEADVVAAVEFLLSDAASYITGTDLLIDGGIVAALSNPDA
jgi:NAD(P)-dependent dehydrogenase (short-subunit alcohol dehydrogenase family)